MSDHRNLRGKLPMVLPDGHPCPICGSKVYLTGVTEWGTDDGEIIGVVYECETEPEIDSPEYPDWFEGHWSAPYIDWLPWETDMLEWLNLNYHYRDEEEEAASGRA